MRSFISITLVAGLALLSISSTFATTPVDQQGGAIQGSVNTAPRGLGRKRLVEDTNDCADSDKEKQSCCEECYSHPSWGRRDREDCLDTCYY
ncbi:hypothetical protein INT45_000876 [Circinella minor]|uniref:Uncharacterized protein n=1 Tax=Circinella minor TaxID=1195481 RepID=A0A8H7S6G6_9FUNG|nr:hypothetical protein INT45_000876 [Circinella minor]